MNPDTFSGRGAFFASLKELPGKTKQGLISSTVRVYHSFGV
jgi:hypothetical protein